MPWPASRSFPPKPAQLHLSANALSPFGFSGNAVPSISGDVSRRPDCFKMADWMQGQLEALGVKVERKALGKHEMDGQELDLPPVLFGTSGLS